MISLRDDGCQGSLKQRFKRRLEQPISQDIVTNTSSTIKGNEKKST